MNRVLRWALGLGIAAMLTIGPFVYYRVQYTTHKRLRVVTPGVLYRSGQMTDEGFADAVARYHIRTIVNVQDDFPDPDISRTYFDRRTVKESAMCQQLGVRFVFVPPDVIARSRAPAEQPAALDRFWEVMDDPANYPVLIHCKAGLHRTGVLVAAYRIEYEGWTPMAAFRELKAQGFGEFVATSANDYIQEYVLTYRPRSQKPEARSQKQRNGGPALPAHRAVADIDSGF